jgi:hypothetical protein
MSSCSSQCLALSKTAHAVTCIENDVPQAVQNPRS